VNFSDYGYYVQHEGEPVEGWETYMHGAEQVEGVDNLYKLEVKPKMVAAVANTVRVLSKETGACKVPPKPRWAVYNNKKIEALEAKIQADVGKGDLAEVGKVRLTDDQLGCDPPPLRLQCRAKDCGELSPVAYIEGSRYAGDWSVVERRKARRPGARKPGGPAGKTGAQPGAKPAGKPAAKPVGKPASPK
jgi:hypothetical protein